MLILGTFCLLIANMIYFCSILLLLWLPVVAIAGGAKVSLRDKIGQMLLVGFDGKKVSAQSPISVAIDKYNIGGVILFDYNYLEKVYDKNIDSPEQVKQLTTDLQSYARKSQKKRHRPSLPLLISVDYEGGNITRLDERYGFPATPSAAKIGKDSIQEAEATALIMAQTLKSSGFNLNFAPVLDININRDNPVIAKKERSFSSDPTLVTQYARIFSRQFLRQNIQCVYKHFPGHGSSTLDSHLGFVDVSHTWHAYELEPYQQLLNTSDSCGAVMTAHIVNRQLDESGKPATLSKKILTDYLRHQLHFNGVIITDDMQMKAISDHYSLEQALVMSINAGADMVIFGNNLTLKPQDPKELIDIIETNVLSGNIKRKRINDAYQHVMILKKTTIH